MQRCVNIKITKKMKINIFYCICLWETPLYVYRLRYHRSNGVMFQWGRTIGDVWIKSWLFKWRLNDSTIKGLWNCHHHHHLSLNHEGRWDTTDDFTTSFLHFSLFSTWTGTWWTPGLSIPWCCLSTSSSVCLVFFPLLLCLARWFWPDLMNGDMSIPLQFASL